MNELLVTLLNFLPAIWARRWWGLAVAWAVALLGMSGILVYKDRYEASATMYVDTQSTLRPLLQGLAVQPDVSEQVHMLARTLLSRANLETVIDADHLLPPGADEHQRALMLQSLSTAVKLDISGNNNIYKLSYIGHDPRKTLGVVRTLMALFVKQGLAGNEQDSTQAVSFIDSQIALYDAKLRDAENRLRRFRTEHPGYSTPGASDFAARQGALQDQLLNLQGQLAAAESSRSAMQAQLAEVPPTLAPQLVPGAPAGQVPASSDIDQRIAAEQARIDTLLQRYTDAYPDVVAARRTLARLEAERRREAASASAAAAAGKPVRHYSEGTNPVYQQLRISLAQSSANVAALQSQIADVRARMEQLRQKEERQPGLDEQYVQLTRDYSVLNDSYQQLVKRRETAMLSRNQDNSQRKDYFRMVDPPRLAPAALFPRRNMLIAVVLVLALGAGTAAAAGLALLFPAFHTARQLREATDLPFLGSITLVRSQELVTRERRDMLWFVVGTGVLVILLVTWGLGNTLHLFQI